MKLENILEKLNSSQKAAVTSPAPALAILAGPGSGKTHTLTARTAWLLKHEGLQPWNIIVATFTVKAAREMKERIGKLIGDGLESKLVIGTFHSIARRYLARYGHLIDIPKDFGIADSSDSLAIIKRIIKRHNFSIDPSTVRSRISYRKAKGLESNVEISPAIKSVEVQEFDTCYIEYEESLNRSCLLDYDDLLLRCVDLLRSHPFCVSNVEAVLIDEFQDTNLVQFDLMRLFASHRKRVTIVGDPDQSIYGFRSAETENYNRLLRQYPETVTIPLEENYRSSGAILLTALEVIQQDHGRIAKSLMATHNVGTRPVLRKLLTAYIEAQWIVSEIQRCLTLTGELMNFDDVAILLRSASLSRHIESALGKAGIAYRMIGGHRFFDRFEVKIILDYMRVINQPDGNDAIARVLNVPPRHVGDTTVKSLLEEADRSGKTLWIVVLDHVRGTRSAKTKITTRTGQGLLSFVNLILTARKKFLEPARSGILVTELMDHIIKNISFKDFIMRTYPNDHESRLANLQELNSQASDFSKLAADSDKDEDALPEVDGLPQDTQSNALSRFLANIALASDAKAQETSVPIAQITISTIHAAKGLEWPVVFIPAAYRGSIPHSRATDADEERRLLYVAMTRAKALLYMSYPIENSHREQTALSPFLAPRSLQPYLTEKGPSFTSDLIQSVAQILNRSVSTDIDCDKIQTLLSFEDDQFSVKEKDDVTESINWVEKDGNPNFIKGQRPPKRQRTDKERIIVNSRDIWRPLHLTTMNSIEPLSTSCVTTKSGFVSASSHLRVLREVGIKCAVEKIGPAAKKDAISRSIGPNKVTDYPNQMNAARLKRCAVGQAEICSFFTKSTELGKPSPKTINACNTKFTTQSSPALLPHGTQASLRNDSQIRGDLGILPSLANHRLGPASRSMPKRTFSEEDAIAKKPYIYLSSSPQKKEETSQEFEGILLSVKQAVKLELTSDTENKVREDTKGVRPGTSICTTIISHPDTIIAPHPRKSYGVRREVKPWSSGVTRPFVPPGRLEGRPT